LGRSGESEAVESWRVYLRWRRLYPERFDEPERSVYVKLPVRGTRVSL